MAKAKLKYRKPYHFYSDIYFSNFHFCPGFSPQDLIKTLDCHFKVKFDFGGKEPLGACIFVDSPSHGPILVIWLLENNRASLTALVHECVHASHSVLDSIQVVPDFRNDEAEAYLTGWIFDNCVKHIKI